jgi:hypothetical protein
MGDFWDLVRSSCSGGACGRKSPAVCELRFGAAAAWN